MCSWVEQAAVARDRSRTNTFFINKMVLEGVKKTKCIKSLSIIKDFL
jgi:hypothetical protein